ncbi:MAG: cobalt ECF transporter T component CbiQ [Candidatus Coatesbacteria bacterium]|nr:MAG: cobalt ECF transporter T component CbiQ [Candidatus Coatesbacteria bacterium]
MRHEFLDKHSERAGPLHRLDARAKTVAVALILLGLNVLRMPPAWLGAAAAGLLLAAVIASRLPLGYVFRRAAVVLPFAVIIGAFLPFTTEGRAVWYPAAFGYGALVTAEGLRLYATVISKAYLSLAYVILLLATTPFRALLRSLAWFRVPAFFLSLLSFTYRYIFVLVDEIERLQRAWTARYFGRRRAAQFRALGPAVGALFVRSYERAERVWAAMLSRGYDPNAV